MTGSPMTGPRPDALASRSRLGPVVIATIMGPKGSTGVQTHFREVGDYLSSGGERPALVTPFSWGGPLSIPVFGTRRLIDPLSGAASVAWYRYWHYAFLKKALERQLQRAPTGPATVYAQCALSARAALVARRDTSQKVVIAIHSDGSQADEWVDKKMLKVGSRQYRAIKDLEHRVLPNVDGIVYVSEAAKRAMLREVPELRNVCSVVIPNFVTLPQNAAYQGGTRDLITVGGLEIAKNHDYLFEVLVEAKRMGRTYSLDVVGDGVQRPHLERLSRSLGLSDQVRFLGFRSDVRTLLPQYRAYVHASVRESLCLAIIEAMGSGLPVISGKVGGIPELFDPGREGLFWPLDDPEEAARTLVSLMEDPQARANLGEAARRRFERCFDSAKKAPELEDFLASVSTGVASTKDKDQRAARLA